MLEARTHGVGKRLYQTVLLFFVALSQALFCEFSILRCRSQELGWQACFLLRRARKQCCRVCSPSFRPPLAGERWEDKDRIQVFGCHSLAMAQTNQAASEAARPAPTQALSELSPATAAIGAWLVKVHRDAQIVPYTYTWEGKPKATKKVEVLLIGQDAETYCIGRARKGSSDDRALQALADKFKAGTTWKMSKVAVLTENRSHLGCTVKVVVDLAKTTWSRDDGGFTSARRLHVSSLPSVFCTSFLRKVRGNVLLQKCCFSIVAPRPAILHIFFALL